RQADREVADVDHLLDLAEALRADLADLEGDERAERLLGGAQALAELAHQLAAARRRARAPFFEPLLGARDDLLVCLLVGGADPAQRLAGGRIERDDLGAGGGDPGAG